MRYIKLLAYMAAALVTASMVFSMIERSMASIICFAAAFIPIGVFCYIMDLHERRMNNN